MKPNFNFVGKILLILMLSTFGFSAVAQKFDQLVRTPDGKYGLITITDTKIHDNVFNLELKVVWVDKNLKPVNETDAMLVLSRDGLKISHPNDVVCTNLGIGAIKSFNQSLKLEFAVNENFNSGVFNFDFDIQYISASNQIAGAQELMFKQPDKLSFKKNVLPGDVVVLDRIPPTILITSSPDLSRGFKPVYDVNQVTLAGKINDESNIFSFKVNGKEYSLAADGSFTVVLNLIEGENKIDLEAIDERSNKATQTVYMRYQPPVIVSTEVPLDTAGGFTSGKYFALIIGVNDYQDININSLDKPVQDAQKLYNALTTYYTFDPENVKFLKNPTYEEIIGALDWYSGKLTASDNLLIFYAGHGHWDEQRQLGYWLPSDAKKSSTASWLRNSTLKDYIGTIQTQHTLLIADACFSGGIFKTRAAFADASKAINKLYEMPSRKAMTSGTLTEVPDESIFLKLLVKRLEQNEVKYISSEALFASFREGVLNNSPTVPQFGTVHGAGDEGGDFIFIRRDK